METQTKSTEDGTRSTQGTRKRDVSYYRWNRAKPDSQAPFGIWIVSCDSSIADPEGLTELEKVETAASELVEEGVFTSYSVGVRGKGNVVNLCMRCYDDIRAVYLAGLKLKAKINGFYCSLICFRKSGTENNKKLLLCADDDLYRFSNARHQLVFRKTDVAPEL